MAFNSNNEIVNICLQGMARAEAGNIDEAIKLYNMAWGKAANDFERFLSAHFMSRHQKTASDKLKWLETALELALKVNDNTIESALPFLYTSIAECYEKLNEHDKAKRNHELASSIKERPSDKGPFYHGTKANLEIGDLLIAGGSSNYKSDLKMNHIYFTALVNGAGLTASLAKGEGLERVYIVEPTGSFENDPNVTNKKFPGNPTRSYRSEEPLRIIGVENDWVRLKPEELQKWRDQLAKNKGQIIN